MASKNRQPKRENLIQFPNVKRTMLGPSTPELPSEHFGDPEVVGHGNADAESITFGALYQLYLNQYAMVHTKTWRDLIENYKRYFSIWTDRKCSSIKRREIQQWVDQLASTKGKHCANRSHDTMRAILNWGLRKDYIVGANPADKIDRYKTKPRERFVQPGDEFSRLASAINTYPDETMRDFFWTCIFTGARKTNIMMMRWDQISFEFNTWLIPDTKNGDSQTITLTKDAVTLLNRRKKSAKSEWVFPSDRRPDTHIVEPKKAFNRIVSNAGIKDLHIHDLRRYPEFRIIPSKLSGVAKSCPLCGTRVS